MDKTYSSKVMELFFFNPSARSEAPFGRTSFDSRLINTSMWKSIRRKHLRECSQSGVLGERLFQHASTGYTNLTAVQAVIVSLEFAYRKKISAELVYLLEILNGFIEAQSAGDHTNASIFHSSIAQAEQFP